MSEAMIDFAKAEGEDHSLSFPSPLADLFRPSTNVLDGRGIAGYATRRWSGSEQWRHVNHADIVETCPVLGVPASALLAVNNGGDSFFLLLSHR